MRKKLLALLMCATMVLGTSVTAMAATSADDAAKVYGENAKKFMNEYYPGNSVLVSKTTNVLRDNKKKEVEYGYKTGATFGNTYDPVVVFKATANETLNTVKMEKGTYYPATQVANTQTITVVEGAAANPANYIANYGATVDAAAGDVIKEKIHNGSITAAGTYAVTVKDDNSNSKQVVLVSYDGAWAGTGAVTGVSYVDKTEGYTDGSENWVKYPDGAADTLVKATTGILKATNEDAYGKLYASLEYTNDLDDEDIMSAIDSGVFSKNAVAVQVKAYKQASFATETLGLEREVAFGAGLAKALYNVDTLQAGTYTFDSDLITRTGFKDAEAVNVFQPTYAAVKYDTELGALVRDFVKVATVAVGDTITFDNAATFVDGVFVFDKGELAAEPEADKNDGVSDTTAPTTDTTKESPKTGDVAPIAALAVVMMGAFGAMVVASKKRA